MNTKFNSSSLKTTTLDMYTLAKSNIVSQINIPVLSKSLYGTP